MRFFRVLSTILTLTLCVGAFAQQSKPLTKKQAEILVPRPALQPVRSLDPAVASPIDTIDTSNPALKIVLYSDNTWRTWTDGNVKMAESLFSEYWNTSSDAYRLPFSSFPDKTTIFLVDESDHYHYPGSVVNPVSISSRYGRRHGRSHMGIDLRHPRGSELYATFDGKVRVAKYVRGYGNLVILRHANGLETFYGHMSEIRVKPDQWVEAGTVIGLAGATGRASGPHLHYEVRYMGYSIDPEWMIDFETTELRHRILVIRKSMLVADSKYVPESDEEEDEIFEADEADRIEAEKREAEARAARYVTIKSGDTLSGIARKNGTTVSELCRLNNITTKTTLRIGRQLRVK